MVLLLLLCFQQLQNFSVEGRRKVAGKFAFKKSRTTIDRLERELRKTKINKRKINLALNVDRNRLCPERSAENRTKKKDYY